MTTLKSGNNTLIFVLIIVVILYIIYSTTNNTDHFNTDTYNHTYEQPLYHQDHRQPVHSHSQDQHNQPMRTHSQEHHQPTHVHSQEHHQPTHAHPQDHHNQTMRTHFQEHRNQPKRNYRKEIRESRDNLSTVSMSDIDDILGTYENRQDIPTDINKLYKHQLGPKCKDANKMNNMYLDDVNKNSLSCLLNKSDGVYDDTEDTFGDADSDDDENDKRRNTRNRYATFNDKINRNGVSLTQVDKIAEIRSDPTNNKMGSYGDNIADVYDNLLSNTYTQKP
jgi:hypothetical protein